MIEDEAKKEYHLFTTEELVGLNYTGEWELDNKRFVKEYKLNIELLNQKEQVEEYE